jgi:hypothetical protein
MVQLPWAVLINSLHKKPPEAFPKLQFLEKLPLGTSKNRLFLDVPLQFLALWTAKHAFLSGKSLKTEVFRDSPLYKTGLLDSFSKVISKKTCVLEMAPLFKNFL